MDDSDSMWAVWVFAMITITMVVWALDWAITRYRFSLANRIRNALCRGEDYYKYYVHLPHIVDMATDLAHWNKWNVYSWMRWVEKTKHKETT